jgi:hypothetical protein
MSPGRGRIDNEYSIDLSRPRDIASAEFNEWRRMLSSQLHSHRSAQGGLISLCIIRRPGEWNMASAKSSARSGHGMMVDFAVFIVVASATAAAHKYQRTRRLRLVSDVEITGKIGG